jgi:hypothetical protein
MELVPRRTSFALVALALAAYVLGFAVYYPDTITVTDEGMYIAQGMALAEGRTSTREVDPRTGQEVVKPLPRYSPGNAGLMIPFIKTFGWRGAFLPAVISVVAAVVLLARWLADAGRSPAWAILLLLYIPFLALGRTGMSDVPSTAWVALTLWLFWRGGQGGQAYWLFAGLTAGMSPLLRETNVLLFAPFFVGALFRRRRGAWLIVLGGLFGLGVYLLCNFMVFGGATARSGEFSAFGLRYVPRNLPAYLVAVLILVPAGGLAAMLYRGEWATELKAAVLAFLLFFTTWWYAGAESGFAKGLVLGAGRFCMPLAVLLIFALAEVVTRLYSRFARGVAEARRRPLRRVALAAVACVVAGAVAASLGVNYGLGRWARSQMQIVRAVHEAIPAGAVVLTNGLGTNKAFHPVFAARFGKKDVLEIADVSVEDAARLLAKGRSVWVAILFRSDSPAWREMNAQNQQWVDRLAGVFHLRTAYDRAVTPTDTLRVWEVVSRPAAAPASRHGVGPGRSAWASAMERDGRPVW